MSADRPDRIIELLVVIEGTTQREAEWRAKLMAASLRKRGGVSNVIVSDIRAEDEDEGDAMGWELLWLGEGV